MVFQSNFLRASSLIQFGLLEVLGVGANEVEPAAGARIVVSPLWTRRLCLGMLHLRTDLGPGAWLTTSAYAVVPNIHQRNPLLDRDLAVVIIRRR